MLLSPRWSRAIRSASSTPPGLPYPRRSVRDKQAVKTVTLRNLSPKMPSRCENSKHSVSLSLITRSVSSQLLQDRRLPHLKLVGGSQQPQNADMRIAGLFITFQNCSAEDNRLGCLVQFSTCGIGSKNSSLLPSQCFSCCSLRAPSLKSRKYQATSLSGLEAVNSPCLSYFPNQVFPIKTGPYLPLTATCTS